jgi:hypothetical protein
MPRTLLAQFSGSVTLGGETTNNIQSLDTTAPERIFMPAISLGYDIHPSGVSKITLSADYTPNFYSVNPALSYNYTSIGATALFYLTNQNDISALSDYSSKLISLPNASHFTRLEEPSRFISPQVSTSTVQDQNDSLVELAVSALYTLSGQLDSTDIATKGLSKKRIGELEDLRDSISDIVSTIADLLDSSGYSESIAEVVRPELEHLRNPLAALMPNTKASRADVSLLDDAIASLKKAKPESDFLATSPSPSSPTPSPSNGSVLSNFKTSLGLGGPETDLAEATEPIITLVSSYSRLRDFGYSDVSVREDLDDSDATTMATRLSIPICYSSHTATQFAKSDSLIFGGTVAGNPNDYHSFTFGTAVEGVTTYWLSLRGSYDFSKIQMPFDSVYSNTENRFRLFARIGLTSSTILASEFSIGFRKYTNPLHVFISGPKGKVLLDKTAESNFRQYSYGVVVDQLIGDRWAVGAGVAINSNPNLQAYVSSFDVIPGRGKGLASKLRPTVQIADDEYTYNLSRFAIFSSSRIFFDIDLGGDFSIEHREYGSAIDRKGNTISGGEGRIENGKYLNLSLSKLLPFADRLAGIFTAFLPSVRIENAKVSANQDGYSYHATNATASLTLTF